MKTEGFVLALLNAGELDPELQRAQADTRGLATQSPLGSIETV